MPAVTRAVSANHYILKLDNIEVGFLRSFEGGHVTAEVIHEAAGPSYFIKKHIGPPRYEPIILEFGLNMNAPIYNWIRASLEMNYLRKNGSIVTLDYNLKPVSEIEFFDALITEVGFPASDASSKDAAYLTVKIQPEITRTKTASGKISSKLNTKQKQWLASNFRLMLDGIDATKVIRIGAFTVKQSFMQDDIGDARDYLKEPGRIDFPNLTVTFSAGASGSWEEWFNSFVIQGKSTDNDEKSGSITWLSPNLQEELLIVELLNVGIFSLKHEKAEANTDAVRRMSAELYCEQMKLKVGK
jgi:phage tail-like protein